jgi:hypothetical protein
VNRTRALALGGVLAVAAVAVLLVLNPFGGTPARGSSLDNGSPVTTQRVTR